MSSEEAADGGVVVSSKKQRSWSCGLLAQTAASVWFAYSVDVTYWTLINAATDFAWRALGYKSFDHFVMPAKKNSRKRKKENEDNNKEQEGSVGKVVCFSNEEGRKLKEAYECSIELFKWSPSANGLIQSKRKTPITYNVFRRQVLLCRKVYQLLGDLYAGKREDKIDAIDSHFKFCETKKDVEEAFNELLFCAPADVAGSQAKGEKEELTLADCCTHKSIYNLRERVARVLIDDNEQEEDEVQDEYNDGRKKRTGTNDDSAYIPIAMEERKLRRQHRQNKGKSVESGKRGGATGYARKWAKLAAEAIETKAMKAMGISGVVNKNKSGKNELLNASEEDSARPMFDRSLLFEGDSLEADF